MLKKIITTTILTLIFLTFNICVYAEPPLNDPSCNYFMPERSTIGAPRPNNNQLAGEFNIQAQPGNTFQQSVRINQYINVQNNAQPANITHQDDVETIETEENSDDVKKYFLCYEAFYKYV